MSPPAALPQLYSYGHALDTSRPHFEGLAAPGGGYAFKPEVTNHNRAMQNLLYGGRLAQFYERFFGEP